MCDVQSLSKYQKRPSPPRPANDASCKGKTFVGNDGNLWKSQPNVNGVFRWVKVGESLPDKKIVKTKSTKTIKNSSSQMRSGSHGDEEVFRMVTTPFLFTLQSPRDIIPLSKATKPMIAFVKKLVAEDMKFSTRGYRNYAKVSSRVVGNKLVTTVRGQNLRLQKGDEYTFKTAKTTGIKPLVIQGEEYFVHTKV